MKANNLLTTLMAAAAATMLTTACSSDAIDSMADNNVTTAQQGDPVSFDAYMKRGTTRAGAAGALTTSTNTDGNVSLQEQGFGVFGYYGDGVLYNQNILPNFMYNEQVTYATDKWTYEPVKYWPNEFGTDARSSGVDRLTLFAYAPWVEVDPSTGSITGSGSTTEGITRLSRATDTGDPYVHYAMSFKPSTCVDLCWGVAKQNYTSSVGNAAGDGKNSVEEGFPYIDVAKPGYDLGGHIKYDFRHALAALNVQIDAAVDNGTPETGPQVGQGTDGDAEGTEAQFTRVWVRYVTFEGFSTTGALNLNNPSASTPYWRSDSRTTYLTTSPVTVNDGRLDGYEGTAAYQYEIPMGLNGKIIQGSAYAAVSVDNILKTTNEATAAGSEPGVVKDPVNLFDVTDIETASQLAAPIYVIPNGTPLKVTIAYDVETYDPKLKSTYLSDGATNGSSIENVISTTVLETPMQAGSKYTVKLHLGLTSVKANAYVDPWGSYGNTADPVDLPQNAITPAP